MNPHLSPILDLEERSWAGATAAELSALLALFAGYSVIIEGQAGSGKNRVVGRYLLAKSRSITQIHIVGRPITTLCSTRYIDIADLGRDEDASGPVDILWIDEANLHDLSGLERCHARYGQIILTYSSDQGFLLGENLNALLKDRSVYPLRLQQNIRSIRSGRAQLKDVLEDPPVYEARFGAIERRMVNLTHADEDPFSTALAIHMIAARYANGKIPIMVVVSRPETLMFLREIGKQIPSPLMETIHPENLQGNDGVVFIYPTAEASSRVMDIFDLEVLSTRSRKKIHIIVQCQTGAVFADSEFIHAPFSKDMSLFFEFIWRQGFVAEPRRNSIMLYDATSFTSSLLLVVYDNAASPSDLFECGRLLIAGLSRKLPASAVPVDILRNDHFREDDPRLLAALQTAVRPAVGHHTAEFVLRPDAASDLRGRR